jgi:hypothetical protein
MAHETLNAISGGFQAFGTVATPIIVAWMGWKIIKGQAVHEAALAEKAKRYEMLVPSLNTILSYRLRVGSYHDRTPIQILKAKRQADRVFWTYSYLWSPDFVSAYHYFITDSFKTCGGHGNLALIRAKKDKYFKFDPDEPKNSNGQPWQVFTNEDVDEDKLHNLYKHLNRAIAADLGLTK